VTIAARPGLSSRTRRALRAVLALLAGSVFAVAQAGVTIEVSGVPEELRANVLAHLSLARYKDRDLDTETLDRLHNRVEREVRDALRPFGYYAPSIDSTLEDANPAAAKLSIRITPGTPVRLRKISVVVTGPGATDPLFLRITNRLPLHYGDQLNHAAYDGLKADLQRTAATYGYLDAKLVRSELRVDPAQQDADVDLALATGERYRFGATTIDQTVIDDALVRRFIRYAQNDPFDVTQLLRTQFALDDSQYFSTLEVLPGDPDRAQHTVPITIHAEPNRRSRYSFGGGYGSDTGPLGIARWENRRVNHRGHRFNVQFEASSIAQTLEAQYVVPIGDPALEKLTYRVSSEQRQLADLNTHALALEPSVTRVAGQWQRVFFITAQHEITSSPIERLDDYLLVPGISIARVPQDYLGEPLFNRSLVAELRGSHGVLGSDANFIQFHATAQRALLLAPQWHLLLRGEFGTSIVAHFSELPGTLRFFAGGDQSVRGFGFDELGPVQKYVDANGVIQRARVGGKHLITGSVEVERDLPRHFGIAAFVDFGNAFDKWGVPPDPDDHNFLEYSAGIGFRLRLPVVTVGIDVAKPLSEAAGPRLNINFSPKL